MAKVSLSPERMSALLKAITAQLHELSATGVGCEQRRTLQALEDDLGYLRTQGKKFAVIVIEE